jgi:DNA (cytosine-5)-methyltransferase 1
MASNLPTYPVVDLFAGSGGLGEGFATVCGDHDQPRFRSVVSIEHDEFSHQTLLLRHFLRCFPRNETPDEYYNYLRGDITLDDLYNHHKPQFKEAQKSALRISLGADAHDKVRSIINQKLTGRAKWALVGGPPCQAYSLVGRSRMMGMPDFEKDERHFLYREYLKIIIDHHPPVFIMENVKGLLSAKVGGDSVINRIVAGLSCPKAALENDANGLNYQLYSLSEPDHPVSDVGPDVDPRLFMVKAEEYGVPQARHRMFIVGIRSDINVRPGQLRRHRPPTVKQTIGNLPAVRSGLSRGEDSIQGWSHAISGLAEMSLAAQLNGAPYAKSVVSGIRLQMKNNARPEARFSQLYPGRTRARHRALSEMYDPRLSVLTGHDARAHMASDLQRYMYAAVFAEATGKSPKLADFPSELLPNHANVALGCTGKMFSDRFKVQLPDQASTTITSHIAKDGHSFIHYDPSQCRSLTVREAARLQTFPDNYKFEGPRTAQYHQVGNAVPPYLAMQIAEVIADVLDSMRDGN